jgi:hypothetical protein
MKRLVLKVLGFFFKSVRNVYSELEKRDEIINNLVRENNKLENLTRRLESRVGEQQLSIDEWRYKYFNKEIFIDEYKGGNDKDDSNYINLVNGSFN